MFIHTHLVLYSLHSKPWQLASDERGPGLGGRGSGPPEAASLGRPVGTVKIQWRWSSLLTNDLGVSYLLCSSDTFGQHFATKHPWTSVRFNWPLPVSWALQRMQWVGEQSAEDITFGALPSSQRSKDRCPGPKCISRGASCRLASVPPGDLTPAWVVEGLTEGWWHPRGGTSFQADWCWEPPQGRLSRGCEARAWPFSQKGPPTTGRVLCEKESQRAHHHSA